jgi:hypothetical protein
MNPGRLRYVTEYKGDSDHATRPQTSRRSGVTGAERHTRYRAAHSAALPEANPVILRQRRPGRAARPGSR